MNWDELDWAALDRLRSLFLAGGGTQGPYWRSRGELASYDFTYGERIGWKWDAVLRELGQRGWKPPGPPAHPGRPGHAAGAATGYAVLDWGCGSGVAGRRVVRWLGADHIAALRLWDHSAMAADYAAEAASLAFPGMPVENVTPGFLAADGPVGLLVISHVLNELPAAELLALRGLAARADAILWVEPGTTEVSRALIEVREQLRVRFRVVAPCTHQAACGLLAPVNARHWCHHFAAPPPAIFADSHWVKFGQRAGIDLRSLPYSFLALERRVPGTDAAADSGFARVIGAPRLYKGFARVLNCEASGVSELMIQKRDAPALFKELKRAAGPLLYRWHRADDRVMGGEAWHGPPDP